MQYIRLLGHEYPLKTASLVWPRWGAGVLRLSHHSILNKYFSSIESREQSQKNAIFPVFQTQLEHILQNGECLQLPNQPTPISTPFVGYPLAEMRSGYLYCAGFAGAVRCKDNRVLYPCAESRPHGQDQPS